jgi:hypothetical protein
MPLDHYHQAVKDALIADGWDVIDPYPIQFARRRVRADLGAERPILGAARNNQRIVVEVKDFLNPSAIAYLQHALGQYLMYKSWLARTEPDRTLYLAVSELAADRVFGQPSVQVLIEDYGLRLLVVDVKLRRIVRWM